MVQAQVDQRRKRTEERNFTNNFAQIRNLIAKSTKQGEMVRIKSNALQQKKEIAQEIRGQQADFLTRKQHLTQNSKSQSNSVIYNSGKQALPVVEFDACEIQEITFNQRHGL